LSPPGGRQGADHLTNAVNGGKLAHRELNDLAERQKRFGVI
jgi:hypothetical protein